jgi:hypothetical protein
MAKKQIDLSTLLERHNCREIAVKALMEALTATRSFNQNGETKSEPDFKTRAQAAAVLLAYCDGTPIARQQVHVSLAERSKTAEEQAEAIARALRLPYGRGKAVLEAKRKQKRA